MSALCAITGWELYSPDHWKYFGSTDDYSGRLTRIGPSIMVLKPSGTPSVEDNERVSSFIFDAIDETFDGGDTFYAFFDYSELRNPPIANCLRVLSNLRVLADRLEKVCFYGMNRRTATIVRMAVSLSGLKDRIHVCRDYREAVGRVPGWENGRPDGIPPSIYVPGEVSALLTIISEVVWNRNFSQSVPVLPESHPLAELYNAVDVMKDDLRRLDEENRRTLETLAEANTRKSKFIADISHEIRTPLGGILGAVDLLSHTPLDANQRRLVKILRSSSKVLAECPRSWGWNPCIFRLVRKLTAFTSSLYRTR